MQVNRNTQLQIEQNTVSLCIQYVSLNEGWLMHELTN